MRKLIFLIFLLVVLKLQAGVDVQFTIQNLAGGTPTNRAVWVTPMSVPSVGSGGVIIGDRYVTNSNNNGLFVISNMPQSQLYLVEVQAPPTKTTFKIYTSTNNPGFVDATNILVADSTATFPAGAVAWAVNASDARYAFKANASGILAAAGTNITAVTNGPGTVVTFSGPVPGQNVAAGNNVTLITNGVTVTIAAAASAQTNLSVAGVTNAGTAAYSNTAAFYLASNQSNFVAVVAGSNVTLTTNGSAVTIAASQAQTNIAAAGVTNAGNLIYSNASSVDLAGTALNATQGLAAIYGTAAKSNASAFALAGIPLTNNDNRPVSLAGSSFASAGPIVVPLLVLTNANTPGTVWNFGNDASPGSALRWYVTGSPGNAMTLSSSGQLVVSSGIVGDASGETNGNATTFFTTGTIPTNRLPINIFDARYDAINAAQNATNNLVSTNDGRAVRLLNSANQFGGYALFVNPSGMTTNALTILPNVDTDNAIYVRQLGTGNDGFTVDPSGNVYGNSFSGDGSRLTNVSVTGVTAGTNIFVSGATVSLVASPSFNGPNVTNIPQANIVSLVSALAGKVSTATAVNTASPLLGGGGLASTLNLSMQKATSGQDGYLSAADFITFAASSGGTEWQTNGNDAGTTGFLGTSNTSDLVFKVNGNRIAKFRGSDGSVIFGGINAPINEDANGGGVILSLGSGNTNNTCSADTAILSGNGNTIVGGTASVIVGGGSNRIWPPGAVPNSAIVGGLGNIILTNAQACFIGGGQQNQAGAFESVVGGGGSNVASGQESTVPGGNLNTASGNFSLAAGNRAKAVNTGAFVWADSQAADYTSPTNDTFNVRSKNGIYLNGQVFMSGSVSKPIKNITTAYTLTNTDYTLLYNGSGSATVITLPTAVGNSNVFVIKNIHATGTCVITNSTGTQNIDGALSILNNVQYRSYTIHADGTQWWIE